MKRRTIFSFYSSLLTFHNFHTYLCHTKRRFGLLQTWVVRTHEFRFTRPLVGFETFAHGELIATDGLDEIRAPCDDCTVLMPARRAIVGREGVYLAQPLA